MALTNTTYRYQYGVMISEAGLNKISKALRIKHPNLFEKTSNIPIKAASGSEPAHTLTLYVLVNQTSLVFDISPITGMTTPDIDMISITMGADFSMTDNRLGFITKIGISVKALAQIVRDTDLKIFLKDFKLLNIQGEAPNFAAAPVKLLRGNNIDTSRPLNAAYRFNQSSDKQLADSFTAIVNYLIDLFLQDALAKPISQFPVPDLSKILKFGNVVFTSDELRGPFLRDNAFYIMLGQDMQTPTDFPAELIPNTDIRVGISQSGLDRIAAGVFPYILPDGDVNHPYNSFYLHYKDLRVDKAEFTINPGDPAIKTNVFFSGTFIIDIGFNVPVVNKHADITIPIPFDPLSRYHGSVTPYLVVDAFTRDDAKTHLHLIVQDKFLKDWYAFVVTDYHNLIYNFVHAWVDKFKDNFVYKFLKHIPIIGWIVDHVFDGAAWIIGYLTGAILDFVVDTTINTLINTLGRAALSIFYTPNFDVYKLSQKDLSDKVGLALKSGEVLCIDNGREGELELRLSFDDLIPAQVISQNLLPLDQPKEPVVVPPPVPGLSDLKTYAAADFLPGFTLPAVNFGATTERFSIVSTVNTPYNGTKVYSGSFTLNIFLQNNQWILQKSLTLSTSASDSSNENSTIIYSNTFQPLSLDIKTVYTDSNGANTNVFHETITNDLQAMTSHASIKNDSFDLVEQTIPILAGPSLDFPEFWIYRLAHTNTAAIKPGKFGRLSVSSPYNYNNWTRIIPVEIKSVADSPIVINGSGGTPVTLPSVKVVAGDEEADYELVILKSGGLYSATIAQQDSSVVIKTA